jgi:XRE family transcriptional regulator, regulator of sulfur utilization
MKNRALSEYLGIALRRFRERQGWSQELLAEYANLNRTYVGELERGQAVPSLHTLEKLAQALGMSVTHLVSEAEQISTSQKIKGLKLTAIAC